MKRTTKKERKENAIKFYNSLKNSGRAVVVVERTNNTNPNCISAKFVTSSPLYENNLMVIADSKALGKEGCFYEFLNNIKSIYPQKGYFEYGFENWLKENYGIEKTYDDGYAMIWEMR